MGYQLSRLFLSALASAVILCLCGVDARASEAESFDDALRLSVEKNRPVLLELFVDD
jgi:hypothetical protein